MNIKSLKITMGRLLENLLIQNSQNSYHHEFNVTKQWGLWPNRDLNPLTSEPRRYWSQADEDGILVKIFERMPSVSKTFVEFGCGDGLQNNSLALISRGWHGGWIDGNLLPYTIPENNKLLKFQKSWVTRENVLELFKNALPVGKPDSLHVTLLSIDLDGNDFHLLSQLIDNGVSADVMVLEYNARFPVGAEWVMPYNAEHTWNGDDYFGASLTSFSKLLNQHKYKLVACSVQGSNAFFINSKHVSAFVDISEDENDLYQPPLYYLVHQWAQKASPRTVEAMLAQQRD